MKTLYESILSSTKSGKNLEINIKYLLKKGFEKIDDNAYRIKGNGNYYHVLFTDERNRIYVTISDTTKSLLTVKKQIENIKDLELVEKYWSEYNGDFQKQRKLRDEIYNKLKTI